MVQGAVDQIRPEHIGLWIHSLGWSSHAGYVEVALVADAVTCGVCWKYSCS